MKRCPNCQRTYADDAPAFCVNDGIQLVTEDAPAYDPQKTMLASAPPPPPQYSNPAPPPQAHQPPPAWPPQAAPPPQGQGQPQNWGGAYYPQPGQQHPYPQQYAPPGAAGGKGLSLASFIIGLISFLAVTLIFLMSQRLIDPDRDVAQICFWGSAALGLVSIVLGTLALISKRQRNKWMAILGAVLGIPGILFFAYILINYGL